MLTLLLYCCAISNAQGQDAYLFIGTYTKSKPAKGIYVYRFNCATGALTKVSTAHNIINPSYITLAPNGKYLYACTETKMPGAGSVSAFTFDSGTGQLAFINKQPSGGENPVYVTVNNTGKWLVNANYTGGSITAFPINPDGSLNPACQVIPFDDSSSNKERQDKSHIHTTVFSLEQDYLLAADLGADKIRIFTFNPLDQQPLQPAAVPFARTKPGSGPRHLAFHPNGKFVYSIEELSGTVAVYAYHDGQLRPVQRIASYARQQEEYASADIHISPDGLFLYTSNRDGENSIAIFAINETTGLPTLAGHQYTGGRQPRNFVIDPTGRYLLVANLASNKVVVFKRDTSTGLLTDTGIKIKVPHPSCLQIRKYGQ